MLWGPDPLMLGDFQGVSGTLKSAGMCIGQMRVSVQNGRCTNKPDCRQIVSPRYTVIYWVSIVPHEKGNFKGATCAWLSGLCESELAAAMRSAVTITVDAC